MEQKQTEELYRVLDLASQLLAEDLDTSYLDGLIEICEDLVQKTIQVENEQPSKVVVERLTTLLNGLRLENYDSESIRKGISLAFLRAVQVDNIQAAHHQTPDAVAMIVAYIVAKFAQKNPQVDILDPLVGMGNLLSTVVNYLKATAVSLGDITGVEIDDSLLALAGISFDLQNITANLIEGDTRTLALPDADIVVADVPLLHQVQSETPDNTLIFAANQALKPGGVAVYVIPSLMLEADDTVQFLSILTQSVYVQGIIKFAPSTFKNTEAAKALLVVQRHGVNAKQAEHVLLAQVPSLKVTDALPQFFNDLNQWIATL